MAGDSSRRLHPGAVCPPGYRACPTAYAALTRRAAEAGISVPELLRREATRLASRPSVEEWLARTRRRPSPISTAEVIEALDELRGPWPDAGG